MHEVNGAEAGSGAGYQFVPNIIDQTQHSTAAPTDKNRKNMDLTSSKFQEEQYTNIQTT